MKVIDKITNTIKSIPQKLSNIISYNDQEDTDKLRKKFSNTTLAVTITIFILTVFNITIGLSSLLNKNESKLRYIEEDGIKYIELVDGYIKEELVVETGTILPELKDYFREDYELPDNISAQYFENKNSLNLEQFTYEKDGDYYLKGIRTIDVVIFGDYEYETKLSIVDTIIPTFTLKELSIEAGKELNLKDFVDTYSDNSQINDYTVSFKEEYDLSKANILDVTLIVCDIANNCNEGTTKLTITAPQTPSGGSTTKPSGGSSTTKPSGGSSTTKPSGGSTTKPSSGSTTKPSGGSKKPSSVHSFNASNVITPEKRSCSVESKKANNYTLSIDHYGTKENITFNYVEYKRDASCHYSITDYSGYPSTSVNYALNKFNGRAKTMLEEAMYIYNTRNTENKEYGEVLVNFMNYTNQVRKNAGLNEVELNYHLCMVATMRAMELVYSNIPFEGHNRPDGTYWITLWDEYGLSVPSARAEIIAYNFATDKLAFNGLMNSPPHREIILTGMYTKTGIGKMTFNKKTYIVQIFST